MAWALSGTPAFALAIVPDGSEGWQNFSASAFFDGASWDGAGCNVGNWISATGGCGWDGFYDRSPSEMPDYLGTGKSGFGFTSEASVTVDFLQRLSAWDSELGWMDAQGTRHALFTNAAAAIGTSYTFSPGGWFALYEQTPDGLFVTNAPAGAPSQFVAFNESADCAVIGAEDIDRAHAVSDDDFQDTVVRVCSPNPTPVPEPATLGLLTLGLCGLAARSVKDRRSRHLVDDMSSK